jgi:hypothetical protein
METIRRNAMNRTEIGLLDVIDREQRERIERKYVEQIKAGRKLTPEELLALEPQAPEDYLSEEWEIERERWDDWFTFAQEWYSGRDWALVYNSRTPPDFMEDKQ